MGSLSSLSATQLGGQAIAAALRAARIGGGGGAASSSNPSSSSSKGGGAGDLDVVDEVIMGNVLSAGLGQVRSVLFVIFPSTLSSSFCDLGLSTSPLPSASSHKPNPHAGPGNASRHPSRPPPNNPILLS